MSCGITLFAQSNRPDSSVITPKKDTTDDLGDLDDISMDELESFLDSILSPHSYFLGSVQIGKGYYNYESKSTYLLETSKKVTYSPVFGYFHKSGLGISATGYIINDNNKFNFFQAALGPSYDYLKNKNLATGIAFTHYFTKDSLPFYTSPLQKELYVYFMWRKLWIKPSVSLNYGWGSRSDYRNSESRMQNSETRV